MKAAWVSGALLVCGCSVGLDPYQFDKGPCEPEVSMNDAFDGSALGPCWKTKQPPSYASLAVANGKLEIVPDAQTEWDLSGTGAFVYQAVGPMNFSMRVVVGTRNSADPSKPPSAANHGAGVMIRSATDGSSFVRYDFGKRAGSSVTQAVSTLEGSYQPQIGEEGGAPVTDLWTDAEGDVVLDICRAGAGSDRIAVARSALGAPWEKPHVFLRDDLRGQLLVGLAVACPDQACDLRAVFDSIQLTQLLVDDDEEDCRKAFE